MVRAEVASCEDRVAVVAHSLLGPIGDCPIAAHTLLNRMGDLSDAARQELVLQIRDQSDVAIEMLVDLVHGGRDALVKALNALAEARPGS